MPKSPFTSENKGKTRIEDLGCLKLALENRLQLKNKWMTVFCENLAISRVSLSQTTKIDQNCHRISGCGNPRSRSDQYRSAQA